MKRTLAIAMVLWAGVGWGQSAAAGSQVQQPQTGADSQITTLTARTTLVLVPTLVTAKGAPVYTLTAKDFVVTDDGVEQKATLEEENGGQPLALVIVAQTGGAGAKQVEKFKGLGALIEAVVGGVPHKVAMVEFDSYAGVSLDFTEDMGKVNHALANMETGDGGAVIFDGLGLAMELLAKQPTTYRRAILLISETVDHGSKMTSQEALRTISDTNTAIYSLGFSSSRTEGKKDLSANAIHGSGDVQPGPPGGCMAKDPEREGDPTDTKAKRALECAGVLLPPVLLVKALVYAALSGLRENVPETVAKMSGGEYFSFGNEKSMQKDLYTLSNHIANHYVLSFHPQAPHAGMHAISVKMPEYKGATVSARAGYWVDGP